MVFKRPSDHIVNRNSKFLIFLNAPLKSFLFPLVGEHDDSPTLSSTFHKKQLKEVAAGKVSCLESVQVLFAEQPSLFQTTSG